MMDIEIRAGIAYSFYAVPYLLPTIQKLVKKIKATLEAQNIFLE